MGCFSKNRIISPANRRRVRHHTVSTFSAGYTRDFHILAGPLDFLPAGTVIQSLPKIPLSPTTINWGAAISEDGQDDLQSFVHGFPGFGMQILFKSIGLPLLKTVGSHSDGLESGAHTSVADAKFIANCGADESIFGTGRSVCASRNGRWPCAIRVFGGKSNHDE